MTSLILAGDLWNQLLLACLGWALAIYPAGIPAAHIERHFPVAAKADFGRAHHDYPATDVFADCGSRVVAPVAGLVLEVNRVDRWDPDTDRGAARGGKFVALRGNDGVRYYGSHLSRVSRSIHPGTMVQVGRQLGRVGHTGSARFTGCHLHVGISPVCNGTGQWRIRRGVIHPYRFLDGWRSGRSLSPAAAVSRWKRGHGCHSGP